MTEHEKKANGKKNAAAQAETDLVETTLYIPEDWELTQKEKYVYRYHHKKLPKLKAGQLSIKGFKFQEIDDEIVVEALISSTVQKAMEIEEMDLILLDENGEPAARKAGDWDELGELPPFSCTAWRIYFTKEDRLSDAAVNDQWQIQFQLKPSDEETLDLDPAWEEQLSAEGRAHLEDLLKKLSPLKPEEVNIAGVSLKVQDDQSIQAVVLVRNGTEKEIQIHEMPLVLKDAAGDIVCQGQFKLAPLTVKPKGAKPWSFIYPKELIVKQDADLSRWSLAVKER